MGFECERVTNTRLIDQILKPTPVFNGSLDVGRQFVWNVNRKSFVPATPIQGKADVSVASSASGAVGPNAGAFPKRQRTIRNRPDPLDRREKPTLDLFRGVLFLLSHVCALDSTRTSSHRFAQSSIVLFLTTEAERMYRWPTDASGSAPAAKVCFRFGLAAPMETSKISLSRPIDGSKCGQGMVQVTMLIVPF